MNSDSFLLSPVTLGGLSLPNRVLMAPMTRNRAEGDGTPTPLMATYYEQRASAGLIITEMTVVSAEGQSYINAPGLWQDSQIAAWRQVTDAVHRAGGRIALQLAHGGRISHPSLLPGDVLPVAPSPIRPAGRVYTRSGPMPYETPRALETTEVALVVEQFAAAARRAKEAGFDGVELHGANGYLLDQFLRDGSNQRTDQYGGSVENRIRLAVEVAQAVAKVLGPERVGYRVSPRSNYNDMSDSNPEQTFTTLAAALRDLKLAYLHVMEPLGAVAESSRLTPLLRSVFGGRTIVNGGFDLASAEAALRNQEADAVAFGVPFLANPDLPSRLATGAPLNTPDPSTFYGGGERGYIDYAAAGRG